MFKVATQILDISNIPVYLAEIIHLDDLVSLLRLPLSSSSVHALWINHAVLCFIRQTLYKGKISLSSPEIGKPEEPNIEIPVNLEAKPESSASSGSSGDSSGTLSGQEGEPVEEKLTDIASSIATNLMKTIKEIVGDKQGELKDAVKKTGLYPGKAEQTQNVCQLVDGFDRNFQIESNHKCYNSYDLVNEIMTSGIWRNKVHMEQQCEEKAFDKESNAEDQKLVSSAFAELAKLSVNSRKFTVIIQQWLSISCVLKDFTSQPILQLPIGVAHSLMVSSEFNSGNKFTSYLFERAMQSIVSREAGSVEVEPLLLLQSSLGQPPNQQVVASRNLSLLKALSECFCISTEPLKDAENTSETLSDICEPDSKCKLFVKNLILEVLRSERYVVFRGRSFVAFLYSPLHLLSCGLRSEML